MIDVPKLIHELRRAGDGWDRGTENVPFMRGMCRQAAEALEQQQGSSTRDVMHRLGLVLIELGRKLAGDNNA